eukprot:5076623-Prymnesium_polylepis.1
MRHALVPRRARTQCGGRTQRAIENLFFAVLRCNRPFFSLAAVAAVQHNDVQSERIQRRQYQRRRSEAV